MFRYIPSDEGEDDEIWASEEPLDERVERALGAAGAPEQAAALGLAARALKREAALAKEQLGRLAGARYAVGLALIFQERPELEAFCLLPRSMDLGLIVRLKDGQEIGAPDWDEPENAWVPALGDSEARQPPDHLAAWHMTHQATSKMLETPAMVDWGINDEEWHGTWVAAGSAADIARQLAMPRVAVWIERAQMESSAAPGASRGRPSGL